MERKTSWFESEIERNGKDKNGRKARRTLKMKRKKGGCRQESDKEEKKKKGERKERVMKEIRGEGKASVVILLARSFNYKPLSRDCTFEPDTHEATNSTLHFGRSRREHLCAPRRGAGLIPHQQSSPADNLGSNIEYWIIKTGRIKACENKSVKPKYEGYKRSEHPY